MRVGRCRSATAVTVGGEHTSVTPTASGGRSLVERISVLLVRQQPEPPLGLVGPRAAGGREVRVETWVRGRPSLDGRRPGRASWRAGFRAAWEIHHRCGGAGGASRGAGRRAGCPGRLRQADRPSGEGPSPACASAVRTAANRASLCAGYGPGCAVRRRLRERQWRRRRPPDWSVDHLAQVDPVAGHRLHQPVAAGRNARASPPARTVGQVPGPGRDV